MGVALGIGFFLVGLGVGIAVGWRLGTRQLEEIQRELARRKAEVRNHVLPLLEQRANGAGVPPDRRARDQTDPLLASIEVGRAIQEIEARRDLPYTDTIEVSREAIQAELRRQAGAPGNSGASGTGTLKR